MTQTQRTDRLKEELYEDFMRLKGIINSGKKESRKLRSAKKSNKSMIMEQEESKRESSNSRQSKQQLDYDDQIQQHYTVPNLIMNTPVKHSPLPNPNSEQNSSSIGSSPYSSLLEQYTNHYHYSIKKFYNLKNSQKKKKHQSASKPDFVEESKQNEVKKKLLFKDQEDGQTYNKPQTFEQIPLKRQIQQLSINNSQRLQQNFDSRPFQIQNVRQIGFQSLLTFKSPYSQVQEPLENLSCRLNSISSNLNVIKSKLAKLGLPSKQNGMNHSQKTRKKVQEIQSQLKRQHIPSFEQFQKQLQIQQHQRNNSAQSTHEIPPTIQTQPLNLQNLPQSDSSCDIQQFNDQVSHHDENSILSQNHQDNIQHNQNL